MPLWRGEQKEALIIRQILGGRRDLLENLIEPHLEVARGFQPFSAAEMQTIRDACRSGASDGHMELFKTTKKYDGDLGREMHGFPSSAELPV
jgi:hypothetical protein